MGMTLFVALPDRSSIADEGRRFVIDATRAGLRRPFSTDIPNFGALLIGRRNWEILNKREYVDARFGMNARSRVRKRRPSKESAARHVGQRQTNFSRERR